jgi:hypothetical protein
MGREKWCVRLVEKKKGILKNRKVLGKLRKIMLDSGNWAR